MRHVPENLLTPLLRVLDEYEAWVKAKPKRTLKDQSRLYDVGRVRLALNKKHNNHKPKSTDSS